MLSSYLKIKININKLLSLLFFWIVFITLLVLLTCFCFNSILHYYAPYGRFTTLPINALIQPIKVVDAIEIWQKLSLIQPFTSPLNGLAGMDIRVVTWRDRPRPNDVYWQLDEVSSNGQKSKKRSGIFSASSTQDWGIIKLDFEPIFDSACKHYELSFSAPNTPQSQSIGLPIYQTEKNIVDSTIIKVISAESNQTKAYKSTSIDTQLKYFYENN